MILILKLKTKNYFYLITNIKFKFFIHLILEWYKRSLLLNFILFDIILSLKKKKYILLKYRLIA